MNVVIVMVVFMRLKILPLSGVMVRNCDGSGYGGYIKISPLGDVMVGDGDHRGAQVPPHGLQKYPCYIVIQF